MHPNLDVRAARRGFTGDQHEQGIACVLKFYSSLSLFLSLSLSLSLSLPPLPCSLRRNVLPAGGRQERQTFCCVEPVPERRPNVSRWV